MMKLILGIDEVGRGPWAGPLVVGAVVLDQEKSIAGLNDSKKLTSQQREKLSREIKKSAAAIGVGWIDAPTIDKIGLSESLKLATKRAYDQILRQIDACEISEIIIDGTINFLGDPRVITMVKADGKVAAVSAASIIAKVFRDHYMAQLDRVFPEYNFATHVGYGTASHKEKLARFGAISGIHRQSFAPIAKLSGNLVQKKPEKVSQTAGRIAENAAAEFLKQHDHQVIVRNWKTKFCEIDIISEHNKILYFTEVKYREKSTFGDGLDAITPKKLKQMKFAAELFLTKHNEFTKDYDVKIAVISLSQKPPQVDEFIESIT